jgi:hypothetical protein
MVNPAPQLEPMKTARSYKGSLQLIPQKTIGPLMDPIDPTRQIVVISLDVKDVITWDISQRPAPN